jgi:hypothetical protein
MSRWLGVAVASLLAVAMPAAARDRGAIIHEFERDGFLIGFSLGFGSSHPCDECPGFGGTFMVGGMAEEELAIVFEVSGVESERDGRDEGLGLATIGARYWPHYKVWLQGGVGLGYRLEESFEDDDEPARRWGAMAGAGYEIVQRGRFAFDVSVRGGIAGDRKSVALTLGFNWY